MLDEVGQDLSRTLDEAMALSRGNLGKAIRFYAPSFIYYKTGYYCSSPVAFPSISITGRSCSLRCKHCEGIVLNTMSPACSPKELVDLCADLKSKGSVGCLISGGCSRKGSVPLDGFIDAIAEVKRNLGLTIIVHTGVINEVTARRLKMAGIDAALIDVVGSNETIREIFDLDVDVGDYENSLRVLRDAGIPTVPHVLVGLHYGRLEGEARAIEMISRYNPSAVIIIVFMPIPGTAMEHVTPPSPQSVARVIANARISMPSVPMALGCMRPKGRHRTETDILAIKAGVNAIAFPAEEAVKFAKSLGCDVSFSSLCCSQIFTDLRDWRA